MMIFSKNNIKNILLVILLIALTAIYFQSEKINDLERINTELNREKNDSFLYIFSISNKSAKLANSLENLSYIKSDSHYDEYKDLFKMADKDLQEWKAETNQLISLGSDNGINNNNPKYHSSVMYNVIMMYRYNNISPTDFSNEWKLALQNTAKLLRALNEDMDSIKRPDWYFRDRSDIIKREVIKTLDKHLDQIYKINNVEMERLQNQIKRLTINNQH